MTPQPAKPAALVFAYLFTGPGLGHPLNEQEALTWLRQASRPDAEYLWLHFDSPHGIGEHWLALFEPSPAFRDTLHEERRSSRLALGHQGLFAVLNDVNYDGTDGKEPEVATLWISIRQHRLLSTWDKPLRSIDELQHQIANGHAFSSPLTLVTQLLSEQADVLMDIVRHIAADASAIETRLARNELPRRSSLGHYRRDLVKLQRLLALEPASLFRIVNRPPRWARDDDLDYLHLATENFAVALRDMVTLQERIRLLEEDIAARVAERSNHSLFILTSVTVISLPMTVIGALFGMNVDGLPLKHSLLGFWVLLAGSAFATLLAAWLVFRFLRDR